jgi:SnoaL-like domain
VIAQSDHAGALARLVAKDAICDAVLRFARGADSSDLELMRSAYWPDATDDHGNFSGNALEFTQFAIEVLKRFRVTMHFITNTAITFPAAGQAHAESYFYAYHEHLPEADKGPAMVTLVGGRYIDRFEERNGEWRILARVVTMEWSEHRPAATLGAATLAQFSKTAQSAARRAD